MKTTYDIIVIGVGAMGSATCWQLAKRGVRVLGIEQFDIAHTRGSVGGDTRLIRKAYYEHTDYVPLLHRSYTLWDELEAASSNRVLFRTGAVYMGPSHGELIDGSLRSAELHHLPHERLDHQALRERYPLFHLPEGYAGLYESDAGFLLSEKAVATLAAQARNHGATINANEKVRRWSTSSSGVVVETDRATYHAQHLIITSGAWTSKLMNDLNVPLQVTRQVLGWVTPNDPEHFALGDWPCWAIEHGQGLFYGFPMRPEESAMKIAYHHRGTPDDPDTLSHETTEADAQDFLPLIEQYLPAATGPVARMHICMYTFSPDEHFIIDRHPSDDRVTFACGFSGHGFKFTPAIGQTLADLAIGGTTDLPIDFLRISRLVQPAS